MALTALIGTGVLDPNFTMMKQIADQAAATTGQSVPVTVLIISQLAQGLLLGPIINIVFTMGEELGWRGFLLRSCCPSANGRPSSSAASSGVSGTRRSLRRGTTSRGIHFGGYL